MAAMFPQNYLAYLHTPSDDAYSDVVDASARAIQSTAALGDPYYNYLYTGPIDPRLAGNLGGPWGGTSWSDEDASDDAPFLPSVASQSSAASSAASSFGGSLLHISGDRPEAPDLIRFSGDRPEAPDLLRFSSDIPKAPSAKTSWGSFQEGPRARIPSGIFDTAHEEAVFADLEKSVALMQLNEPQLAASLAKAPLAQGRKQPLENKRRQKIPLRVVETYKDSKDVQHIQRMKERAATTEQAKENVLDRGNSTVALDKAYVKKFQSAMRDHSTEVLQGLLKVEQSRKPDIDPQIRQLDAARIWLMEDEIAKRRSKTAAPVQEFTQAGGYA